MPIHLTVLLVFAGIMYADPIPLGALVWSGTATSTSLECSPPPTITFTDTGVGAGSDGMGFAPGLMTEYTVDTGFTVTAAGDFLLSSSGSYDYTASTCAPGGCKEPNAEFPVFDANFSAGVGISDSNGNPVFRESLGESGSSPYGNCEFGGVDCIAWLSLTDSASGIVDLATGNYTLELSYYGTNDGIGDNFGAGGVNGNLVPNLDPDPAPEPRELGLLIAGMAIVFLIKLRHRDLPV